jgi:hypothetical protein
MPKFTSWQYFGLMAVSLAGLTALAILGKVDTSILVGVLLSILGVGAHISGVNTAVPLQSVAPAPAPAPAVPTVPGEAG